MLSKKLITTLVGAVVVIGGVSALALVHSAKQVTPESQVVASKSVKPKSKHTPAEPSAEPSLDKDAKRKEVEINPSGETGTDRRAPKDGSAAPSVSEKEIAVAGETGEYSEKVYDVKTHDGITVSEEDIANARKTLKDAGINEAMYSDLDIAKVIKAASEKSLDVVTVAKDGKF